MKTIKAQLNSDQRKALLKNLTFDATFFIFNDDTCFIISTTPSNAQKAISFLSQITFEISDTQEEMINFAKNNKYEIEGNIKLVSLSIIK